MLILSIDTALRTCSGALGEEGRVLAERTLDEGLTHSETLMPLIDSLYAEAGRRPEQTGLIAVSAGPGSFTGVRIGVCAAKGFAQALKIPIARIDTLELLSANAGGRGGLIYPMIDARRGEVYCALFKDGQRLTMDEPLSIGSAVKRLEGRSALFIGDGAVALKEEIKRLCPGAEFGEDNFPHAERAFALALLRPFDDAASVRPVYLRESQAERKRNEARS